MRFYYFRFFVCAYLMGSLRQAMFVILFCGFLSLLKIKKKNENKEKKKKSRLAFNVFTKCEYIVMATATDRFIPRHNNNNTIFDLEN